jgi:hypothetical protein
LRSFELAERGSAAVRVTFLGGDPEQTGNEAADGVAFSPGPRPSRRATKIALGRRAGRTRIGSQRPDKLQSMRMLFPVACTVILVSCSSTSEQRPKQAETAQPVTAARPSDESRRLPQANLISSEFVDSQLLGKVFMPGSTIARYRKGKAECQMFVARAANASAAAVILSQWRSTISNPQFVASFGGYFGADGPAQVFVFTKGEWIAGVVGLDREQADAVARLLAARL